MSTPEPIEEISAARQWRELAFLAVATVLCLAPFLDKAYCIDDPLFLWAGRHIQSHPVDFFGFDINWEGFQQPMYDNTKNPPLGCYYIALAAAIVGWSERALHGAFLLPAIGTIWGTWRLAQSLCRAPVAAALAALVTPVFLVSSTNVMCDTLALCSYVWAIVLWKQGLDVDRLEWLVASAFLIAVSTLTKYFAVSLIPLLAVYTFLRQREAGVASGTELARKLALFLIPILLLACYQWGTAHFYGRGLLFDAADTARHVRSHDGRPFWNHALTLLCFSGGCLAPVACCAPWFVPRSWMGGLGALAAAIGWGLFATKPEAISALSDVPQFRAELSAQIGLFAAAGGLVLWLAAADLRDRRDSSAVLLALWLWGTAFFAGYVNWTCNGRSILPMAPAAAILLVRRIEDRTGAPPVLGLSWRWGLVPALALGLAVAWGDYRYAGAAREAAGNIAEFARLRRRTLWIEGHWGFQWYMEAAGAKSVDFHNPLIRTSDYLAMPSLIKSTAWRVPQDPLGKVLQVFNVPGSSWLATLDKQSAAGFYASVYGPMPFVFGSFPPELFVVFEIFDDNVFGEDPRSSPAE